MNLMRKKPKTWLLLKGILLFVLAVCSALMSLQANPFDADWLNDFVNGLGPLYIIVTSATIMFVIDSISVIDAPEEITYEGFRCLVAAFNEIVSCKLQRFTSARSVGGFSRCLIATQPNDQLKEIVTQIFNIFRNVSGLNVKVSLAEKKPDGGIRIICLAPHSHSTVLKNKSPLNGTFIDSIFDGKSFDSIPDLKANFKNRLKPYYYINNKPSDGSIIGFPIFEPDSEEVQCVLTVKSEDKIFDVKSEKMYGQLLKMFVVRIQLERALIDIRAGYVECSNQRSGPKKRASSLQVKGV